MSGAVVVALVVAWAIGLVTGLWIRGHAAGTRHRPAVLVDAPPRVELSCGATRATQRRLHRNRADLRKALAR